MKIRRKQLAEIIAERLGVDEHQAKKFILVFEDVVVNELAIGNEVEIRGFGTFEKKAVKARNGRNPATGEPIVIPAKNLAKFRSSKRFDRIMNQ
jgi:nucleoid DNA-binding protein